MTGIWRAAFSGGRKRCARCHKLFTPTSPDQRYGPRCAAKMQSAHIEVKNTKGETLAVIV